MERTEFYVHPQRTFLWLNRRRASFVNPFSYSSLDSLTHSAGIFLNIKNLLCSDIFYLKDKRRRRLELKELLSNWTGAKIEIGLDVSIRRSSFGLDALSSRDSDSFTSCRIFFHSSSSSKLAQCDNIDLNSKKLSYINESISDNCTFLSAALRARSRFPFYAFLYASFLSNFLILQVPFKKVQIRKNYLRCPFAITNGEDRFLYLRGNFFA